MSGSNRPILLVEDNPMDVDLTLRALRRRRLTNTIQVARDGEEALQHVDQWSKGAPVPVVVLLDLKLPRIGGLEVLRRIKSHPDHASVPVVVLTTSRDDGDVKTAYQHGANSYIVKPVDFEKFVEVAAQIELYWTVLNEQPR